MWFVEHHLVIASFFIAKFCWALLGGQGWGWGYDNGFEMKQVDPSLYA